MVYGGYALTSLLLHNTVRLSGKTSVNMAEFSSENSKTGSETNDKQLKLKTVGLDSDPYNLPKHQWSTDIDS